MPMFQSSDILNLLTLTSLEIILGIDNVIFIALLVEPLPLVIQKKVRFLGLTIALFLRILLLLFTSYIINLKHPLLQIFSYSLTSKNLLFITGGMFLIYKSVAELLTMIKSNNKEHHNQIINLSGMWSIIAQIIFIDLLLSLDSIITAVGISSNNLTVIVLAVIISLFVMLFLSDAVSRFIHQYPNIKVIGLTFISLVGIYLILEGFDIQCSKGYLYSTLIFSLIVEMFNILILKPKR